MCVDVPDTPEHAGECGYPGNDERRGPFPQIQVVGFGECGTRAVLAAGIHVLWHAGSSRGSTVLPSIMWDGSTGETGGRLRDQR